MIGLSGILPAALGPTIERIGWVLFHSLWQFTVIALLASVVIYFLKNKSANSRYLALVSLFCLLPISIVATWAGLGDGQQLSQHTLAIDDHTAELMNRPKSRSSSNPILIQRTRPSTASEKKNEKVPSNSVPAASSNSTISTSSMPPVAAISRTAAMDESNPLTLSITVPNPTLQKSWIANAELAIRPYLIWFVGIWLVGILVFLFRPLLGWIYLRRLGNEGACQPSKEIQKIALKLSQKLNLRKNTKVLTSTIAMVPMVVGYWRPVILLPVSLITSLSIQQIEAVLAHELAHVRRHDFLVNLFQILTETFFFYHPGVWWLSHRIRGERENCCDDIVIGLTNDRSEYGRALITIAEQNQSHPSLALGATDGQLLHRIRRLAGLTTSDSHRMAWPLLNGMIVVGTFIVFTFLLSIGFPTWSRSAIGSDFAKDGLVKADSNSKLMNRDFSNKNAGKNRSLPNEADPDNQNKNNDGLPDIGFLSQYPKLQKISYEFGAPELASYLDSENVRYRRFINNEGIETYLLNADDTYCVRVSFGTYGDCVEIKRIRSSVRQDMVETIKRSTFSLPDNGYVSAIGLDTKTNQLVTVSPWYYVTIKRWDIKTKKLISEIKLKQHGGQNENRAAIKARRRFLRSTVQLSSDASKVIMATYDYVGIWDTKTGDFVRKLEFPTSKWEYDSVRRIATSDDLSVIVGQLGTSYDRTTRIYDAHVIVWDGNTGKQLRMITDKRGTALSDIDLSKDGKRLATSNGGRTRVWNVENGKMIAEIRNKNDLPKDEKPSYGDYIWTAKLSPDGKTIAIGDLLGAKLWNIDSKKLVHQMEGDYRYSNSSHGAQLAFSEDGKYLLRTGTGSTEKGYYIPIWSTQTGQKHFELLTESNSVQFLDNNSRLAVGFEDREKSLGIWQLSGKPSKDDLNYKPSYKPGFDSISSRYVYKGKKADELIKKWNPVWGPKYNHGLRAGLALTDNPKTFKDGDRVSLVVFLQNWSDKPFQIDIRSDLYTHLPEIKDADGNVVKLQCKKFLGQPPLYRDQLGPGESYGPFHISFGIGQNPLPAKQNWSPFAPFTPGEYELGIELPLRVAGPKTGDRSTVYKWVEHQHLTGKLKFQIE